MEGRSHPLCSLSEVQRRRRGVVADVGIGEDDLIIEYKVVCACAHVVCSACVVCAWGGAVTINVLIMGCDTLQGKITVKHAVLSDLAPGSKSLWKQKYVLQYSVAYL